MSAKDGNSNKKNRENKTDLMVSDLQTKLTRQMWTFTDHMERHILKKSQLKVPLVTSGAKNNF